MLALTGTLGVLLAVLATCALANGDRPAYLQRHKLPEPVLRPTHRAGDFDSDMVDCPQVLRWGERWLMQYTGFDGRKYRIGVALSDDLIHWERAGMILDAGQEGEWDYGSSGGGWLIEHDGWWYLFYCGFPLPGYEVGPGGTGLAKGRDIHRGGFKNGTEAFSRRLSRQDGGLALQENASVLFLKPHPSPAEAPRSAVPAALAGR